jgi:hypothetical protein
MADEVAGVNYCMGKGVIDFPVPEVISFLKADEYKKLYDNLHKKGYIIESASPYAEYEYYEIKSPPMIANRDFCLLKGVFEDIHPDKKIAVAYSVKHPKCPEVSIRN